MKCDRTGCTNDAVAIGQGFELGKEFSARCPSHPWSLEERRAMIESHGRSMAAWQRLTETEQAFVLSAPGEERTQVFRALVRAKVDGPGGN